MLLRESRIAGIIYYQWTLPRADYRPATESQPPKRDKPWPP